MPTPTFVVPSFHYDVAYLKSYREYLPRCFEILDEALRLLEEHPDYTFLVEQVILLGEYWRARPEKHQKMRDFARQDRFVVAPGQWTMPDLNHPGGEALFAQNRVGKEWLQTHLGIEPKVCWIADCWGHPATLPQIMSQSGYDFYVFWRCMRPDVMKNDFRWRGIDGTTIKTHWLARGYGNIRFPDAGEIVNAPDLNFWGASPAAIQSLRAQIGEHGDENDHLLLCNGGDMFFPQSTAPQAVESLRKAGLEISFASPQTFLETVNWNEKPVVEGEFNGAFQGSYTTNIRIKQRARALTNRILALETLSVTQNAPCDLENEWKIVLKQQFHDIICGTICDAALEECHTEFDGLEARLNQIQREFLAQGGERGWFNTLGFAREEIVEHEGQKWRVSLPSLGFISQSAARIVCGGSGASLPLEWQNEFFNVKFDERGFISSLCDSISGREIVDAIHKAPFGAVTLQVDGGDSWLNFDSPLSGGSLESSLTQNSADPFDTYDASSIVNRGTFLPAIESARVIEDCEEVLIVEQTGRTKFWRLGPSFTTQVSCFKASRRIEYRTELTPHGRHYRLRAVFPTTLKTGRRRDEVAFGTQKDRIGEHAVQNFLDCSDETGGLTLFNRGLPGNNVDSGTLLLTLFRAAAMEYKCDSSQSFGEGVPHVFEYAIWPHGAQCDAQIVREGAAFNTPPLQSAPVSKNWNLESSTVQLSALRKRGDAVFVRLYEATGFPTRAVLTVPSSIKQWALADGLECTNSDSDWRECEGTIEIALRAWEIRGILLRG